MKLYVALFFIIYVIYVTAMEPLGMGAFDNISTNLDLQDCWKVATASKRTYGMIHNGTTYLNHIHKFMKEHHGDNYTCNKIKLGYVCQSILTHPKMTFEGHPGFELEELFPKLGGACKIIGPIQGQGKERGITDMMVIRDINGHLPIVYASGPENIRTLTKYWEKDDTEYNLTFEYHISNDEAKTLFQKNKDLGLCDIELDVIDVDLYDDRTLTFQYDSINDIFEYSRDDAVIDNDAMRYTFDFSKSEYYQQKQK
jgi:hypothetical protein